MLSYFKHDSFVLVGDCGPSLQLRRSFDILSNSFTDGYFGLGQVLTSLIATKVIHTEFLCGCHQVCLETVHFILSFH